MCYQDKLTLRRKILRLYGIGIIIMVGSLVSGCGSFDSLKKSEVESERDEVREIVREFREFENFSADIPVAWIESIRLPSGTEIVLREDRTSNTEQGTANVEVDSARSAEEEPMVRLGFERGTESRDSARVVESEDRTESIEKETSVDTGSPFLFLIIGIAVGLAGIILLYIYKPW